MSSCSVGASPPSPGCSSNGSVGTNVIGAWYDQSSSPTDKQRQCLCCFRRRRRRRYGDLFLLLTARRVSGGLFKSTFYRSRRAANENNELSISTARLIDSGIGQAPEEWVAKSPHGCSE